VIFCPRSGGILALEGFNEKQSPNFLVSPYYSKLSPPVYRECDKY